MRCAATACDDTKKSGYQAMQYPLHLAEHSLADIQKEKEAPAFQYDSVLPGPFLSGKDGDYDKCEWLDTAFQAPLQTVHYKNFGIWDWDVDQQVNCVIMMMREGDGNPGIFKLAQIIGPTDSPDDFVGFFKICRDQTLDASGLTLQNLSKDLTVSFSTGDTQCGKI